MNIDIELVKKARLGDKGSFSQIYDGIAKDLYKIALFSLGNNFDAQDVVADTFLEAYKGIAKLRDETAFKGWIMKILNIKIKHKIGDYIKSRNVIDIDEIALTHHDDFDLLTMQSDYTTVVESLDKLTHDERQIVILSSAYGYTTKEISKMLDSPHGTICSKLHRTLAKLRNDII